MGKWPGRILLCALATLVVAPAAVAQAPTFSNEVVRIFQQNCQTCHRPGDIAPFSLVDYQSARLYSQAIKTAVTARRMPPWKPVPGHGEFRDARLLSPQQIDTLVRWADGGAPEGDPRDLPPPLTFPDGWSLGRPDLVLSMEEFSVPDSGDLYRCFSLPVSLAQDRYVGAIEVRPGNRAVVHHVLLFGDSTAQSRGLDEREPGQGYTCFGGPGFTPDDDFFGGWAPGVRPFSFESGFGMRLRANSRIAMQLHYHSSAGGQRDTTQVGIYFSSTPVDKIVRVLPLANTTFMIPAGAARHQVTASASTPRLSLFNAHLVGIAPHMHLLGREMRVQATYTDGRTVPLIYIDDWDFQWQGVYLYTRPVPFPGGATMAFSAVYDNSANNPNNPNSPPRDVRWGERTTDEMALVFFLYTQDSEHLAAPQAAAAGLVNAASFAAGTPAPGEIVSLFGSGFSSAYETAARLPLPTRLSGGTRISVGGVEAPLFYVSPTQINFQVPVELSTATATVTVTRGDDGAAQSFQISLAAARPGIFTYGSGLAAALNARTGALIGPENPVARGEWVSLFASGLGRVSPAARSGAAPDGLSTTLELPAVLMGNARAEVSFSGLAPGFAGLYQVNFRMPENVTGEVAVKLSLGGVESNTVRIPVR